MLRFTLIDFGDTISKVILSKPNPLIRLIEGALQEQLVYTNDSNGSDIIILGPYGNDKATERILEASGWKLFITGENIAPNYALCDASLSFQEESYQGRNFRLPVWMFELNWFEDTETTFTRAETEYLLTQNRPLNFNVSAFLTRKPEVLAVFNAFESNRFAVARKFSDKNLLVGVGRPFGNENQWSGGFYRGKCELISSFMCNMCFENTVSTGYITEKPLHARAMGALPLLSCNTSLPDFNWLPTLNLTNFSSLDEFIEITMFYLARPSLLFEKLDSPIFQNIPNIQNAQFFIRNAFSKHS